jgi:hypothetical protein
MTSMYAEDETQTVKRPVWEPLPARAPHSEPGEVLAKDWVRLDTPLVLICPVEYFTVYWVPELSSVLVRATAQATVKHLAGAMGMAAQVGADFDAAAFILDLTEAAPQLMWLTPAALFAGAGPLNCLSIVTGAKSRSPAAGFCQFESLLQAFEDLRTRGVVCDPTDMIHAALAEQGAALIAGTYAGCAYWIEASKTVAMVWSGDEADAQGMDFVYEAVAAYTQYLRIEHVILDARNHIFFETYNRVCLQVFIDASVFRGVKHFALVGSPGTLSKGGDPITEYLDAMMGIDHVELVESFEEALDSTCGANLSLRFDS